MLEKASTKKKPKKTPTFDDEEGETQPSARPMVENEVDLALAKAKALATHVHMSTQCEQMIESKSASGNFYNNKTGIRPVS